MTTSPSGQSGRHAGDGRHTSFAGQTFNSLDPRNHRIDTLIGAQAQTASGSSAYDTSSPVSVDFNFPFAGSPHDSINSGIDAPPELRMAQGYHGRGSMSEVSRGQLPNMPQRHRASLASIDSAMDTELMTSGAMGGWSSNDQQAVSKPDELDLDAADNDNDQQKRRPSEEDKSQPAWSELKTKAGKERKRLPLACIACRRKKIRCSGEKPACRHCMRARVPCVYKVTTRKAAPRTDYMAMLDKRLKRMEDRVIKVIPKDELPDMSVTGRASVKPPLPGAQSTNKKDKGSNIDDAKKRSAEEAFTAELTSWTSSNRPKSAVLDPITGLRRQREGENKLFIEGSEALPPQHIQEHLAEVFFDCVYGQSYLLLHKPSFLRKLKAGTVPPVLILAVCAVSARFSTHPQVSTEPAFLRGEQWATPARKIIERRHYEPNITILIAMLMLGLHHFGTCEGGLSWSFGGQASRMGYALQLHRELEKEPMGREQLAGKSKPNNPAGTQDGTQPQIKTNSNDTSNTNPPISPELSFTDREIRRRTMWACYLMDTFNSSGTERPSFLSEEYFQIQLPMKESHFQMEIPGVTENLDGDVPSQPQRRPKPGATIAATNEVTALQAEARSNMGVAAYVIRGVVLWKRIVKYLNLGGKEKDPHSIWDPLSEFTALARQITALKQSLPSDLVYTSANLATHASSRLGNQFLLLHIMLAQCSLFLHRFAIPTHPTSRPHHTPLLASGMPKTFLTQSAQTVVDAAGQISSIIAASAGHTLTVPFAGYCAYASATVHVWGIFSRLPSLETTSKENLRHNYRYLTRMKRYWGMFHYMAESVKDTYRAFADSFARYSSLAATGASLLRSRSSTNNAIDVEGSPVDGMSRSQTPAGGKASHSASSSIATAPGVQETKAMFQYGDWFDKYPHGVSEAEWETSHLEYKRESSGGTEAVMSHRSELQSVEEFFASLTPPSKGEEMQSGRNKKIARRRGKSVADSGTASTARKPSTSAGQQNDPKGSAQQRAPGSTTAQAQQQHRPSATDLTLSTSAADIGNLGSRAEYDLSSPPLYRNIPPSSMDPYSASTTTFSPSQQQHHNFHFPAFPSTAIPQHAVSNLDRQMVFGAYAGIDSSNMDMSIPGGISSASPDFGAGGAWADMTDPNNVNFGFQQDNSMGIGTDDTSNTDPWQTSGMGFGGNPQFGMNASAMSNGMGTGSTAFFMPFNMEPPNFGTGTGSELGGGQLDGMDFGISPGAGSSIMGDLGGGVATGVEQTQAGGRVGSFSGQGGGGGAM